LGIVYKSWDPVIDRIVAIKTIDLGLSPAGSRAFEQRFDREARPRGASTIQHRHDIRHGPGGDVAYIAMELLEGRTLRAILESGSCFRLR
jgi:serine/threonine-protein kinase